MAASAELDLAGASDLQSKIQPEWCDDGEAGAHGGLFFLNRNKQRALVLASSLSLLLLRLQQRGKTWNGFGEAQNLQVSKRPHLR